jgi:hypothetical protein
MAAPLRLGFVTEEAVLVQPILGMPIDDESTLINWIPVRLNKSSIKTS